MDLDVSTVTATADVRKIVVRFRPINSEVARVNIIIATVLRAQSAVAYMYVALSPSRP